MASQTIASSAKLILFTEFSSFRPSTTIPAPPPPPPGDFHRSCKTSSSDEQQQIQKLLNILHIVPVSASIAKRGGLLKKKFAKSHGLGIADAVIAATALEEDAGLITLNLKHFPMIKAKEAPY